MNLKQKINNITSPIKAIIILLGLVSISLTFYIHSEWDYHYKHYDVNLSNIASQNLEHWYVDLSRKYNSNRLFDKNGIPLVDYANAGIHYNPVTISQYALGVYEHYLSKRQEIDRQIFLTQANWLVENIKETTKGFGVWYYHFSPGGISDLEIPWVSAMAQGEAISVLLRAYLMTSDTAYLKTAEKALDSFNYTLEEGGVRSIDKGLIYYEEVPSKQAFHILNGFIASLFGIYDFYRVTGSVTALKLFNDGVTTLISKLDHYDTGFWSKYCFYGFRDLTHIIEPLASMHYHNVHIGQLKVMYAITGKNIFREYSDKWNQYQHKFTCKLMHFFYSKLFFRAQRLLYKMNYLYFSSSP
ncbi:MAG: D-glucuronyl C5-epimerase family protein [Deltaproteobacteria bacterium]|jgi:hypothetical protein|nr:D-glucuronyl C5-epimerase family protein [Deltaproteobacteria bacterium]